MTIDQVKKIQADLGLGKLHVVYIDPNSGFWMAHTDDERGSGIDLEECLFHELMCEQPYVSIAGYYTIREDGWIRAISF